MKNHAETERKLEQLKQAVENLDFEVHGLKQGAVDYITKPFAKEILLARVELHLAQSHTRRLARMNQMVFNEEKVRRTKSMLTETEWRVAEKIAQGHTNQEIAEEMSYSTGYVKNISGRIFSKLNLQKRQELRQFLSNEYE